MAGRKKFTLKSGNTVPFKQMGSSPVKAGEADATLVAAAKAAAMANVPKDLSAQYNLAAEGAIAAHKGKTEMLTKLAKEVPGIVVAAGRGIGKALAKRKAKKAGTYQTAQAKEDFETRWEEKHKDRKSITEIRKMTGASGESKKSGASEHDVMQTYLQSQTD